MNILKEGAGEVLLEAAIRGILMEKYSSLAVWFIPVIGKLI